MSSESGQMVGRTFGSHVLASSSRISYQRISHIATCETLASDPAVKNSLRRRHQLSLRYHVNVNGVNQNVVAKRASLTVSAGLCNRNGLKKKR